MQKAICQHPIDKKTKIFSEFCIILQILAQNNSVHKKNVNKIKEVIISCYGLTLKTIIFYVISFPIGIDAPIDSATALRTLASSSTSRS